MNLAADANHAWRSVKFKAKDESATAFVKTAIVVNVASSKLTFAFSIGHPSDALPSSRSIVPYYEMPLYRTNGDVLVPGRKLTVDKGGRFTIPTAVDVRCNNTK
jgi:hypothetical protein